MAYRQTDGQADRKVDRQKGIQTEMGTDRKVDRQKGR